MHRAACGRAGCVHQSQMFGSGQGAAAGAPQGSAQRRGRPGPDGRPWHEELWAGRGGTSPSSGFVTAAPVGSDASPGSPLSLRGGETGPGRTSTLMLVSMSRSCSRCPWSRPSPLSPGPLVPSTMPALHRQPRLQHGARRRRAIGPVPSHGHPGPSPDRAAEPGARRWAQRWAVVGRQQTRGCDGVCTWPEVSEVCRGRGTGRGQL